MSIQQTLVGLEDNFAGRASTLSRTISRDNTIADNEAPWLMLSAPFPMRRVRVHTRAPSEVKIETDALEDIIQSAIEEELDDDTTFNRDVAIGAMYTDDLPISGHAYSNVFVVVSFGLTSDIPLPRDAHISVEMYFGWRSDGDTVSIADEWYLNVGVSNVGAVRRNAVKSAVRSSLTSSDGGPSAGDQIRDGLGLFFNRSGIRTWYVIPGNGEHNGQESDVLVRHEASFFVVE